MPRSVFATFETEAAADRALTLIASQIALLDSAVVTAGTAGDLTLESLNLTASERSACSAQMKRGGYLMVAQADHDQDADRLLRILHGMTSDQAPMIIAEAPRDAPPVADAPQAPPAPAQQREERTVAEEPAVEEERIPIVQEEIRVGKSQVIRGGVRVQSRVREVPVQEHVELAEERIDVETRPANRRLSEEELAEAGLLKDRIIEVTAMREEAVVTREAFVREEILVTKTLEQRTEEINDTVRITEVETERLQPGDVRGGSRRP